LFYAFFLCGKSRLQRDSISGPSSP
jgi:hypothetical protein